MGLGVRNWKSDLYFDHIGLVAVTVHFDAGCDAVSDGPTYRGYQPKLCGCFSPTANISKMRSNERIDRQDIELLLSTCHCTESSSCRTNRNLSNCIPSQLPAPLHEHQVSVEPASTACRLSRHSPKHQHRQPSLCICLMVRIFDKESKVL